MPMVQSVAFGRNLSTRKPSASSAPPPKSVSVLTATATQGASNVTYAIPRLATIDSDNKPHKVKIIKII
jgi:hypothetical protein